MSRPALLTATSPRSSASISSRDEHGVAGLIVGWGIPTGLAPSARLGMLFLIAITMIWVGTLVGAVARSPDGVQGIAFVAIFPLTFVANTFVPVGGLPDGLRQVAEYNPISAWAAAVRTRFGNPTAIPRGRPGRWSTRWSPRSPGASRSSWSSSRSPCGPTANGRRAEVDEPPGAPLYSRRRARGLQSR